MWTRPVALNMKKWLETGVFSMALGLPVLWLGGTGCSSSQPDTVAAQHAKYAQTYPRLVEAKFLARLDVNGEVLEDTNSTEWPSALYHAMRVEARDPKADNFDPSAYEVDQATFAVKTLAGAYEKEPFTGTVVINHSDGTRRLVAYINRGIMIGLGSEWNDQNVERRRVEYDELGQLLEDREFDSNGTQIAFYNYRPDPVLPEPPGGGSETNTPPTTVTNTPPTTATNALPAGKILAADTRVGGELIFDATDTNEFPLPYTGTVVEFYDDAFTKKKREEPVNFGRHTGTVKWWYENGNPWFEAEYAKGEPQGRTVWYREDGTVEYEGHWQDNKLDRATTWDPDDNQTGQVLDGNGSLVYLHPNGMKRLEETWANGEITDTKWWDEEGNTVESVNPAYIPPIPRAP